MRSVKKGNVSFGLVSVGVKMYSATEDHDVKTHQIHGADGGRIRYKKICEDCGAVVEQGDLIKGVPHGDNGEHMVHLTDEDLATLDDEQGPNFEVLQFVHMDEIDPILFESTYYLDADKGGEESYALMHHVLTESDRYGIVKFLYRSKTRMGVLRVMGDVLAIHTIRWHDEVRDPSVLVGAQKASRLTLNPKMVELGHALVESMMADWDPAEYTDTYTERFHELVAAKASGEEFVVEEADDDTPSDVADLLAKLEASVAAGGKKKGRRTEDEIAASTRHPAGRKRTATKKTA